MFKADCDHTVPNIDVRKCFKCYSKFCKDCMADDSCCNGCNDELIAVKNFRSTIENGKTTLGEIGDKESTTFSLLQTELKIANSFVNDVEGGNPVMHDDEETEDIMCDCGETIETLNTELQQRIDNIVKGIDNEPRTFGIISDDSDDDEDNDE